MGLRMSRRMENICFGGRCDPPTLEESAPCHLLQHEEEEEGSGMKCTHLNGGSRSDELLGLGWGELARHEALQVSLFLLQELLRVGLWMFELKVARLSGAGGGRSGENADEPREDIIEARFPSAFGREPIETNQRTR